MTVPQRHASSIFIVMGIYFLISNCAALSLKNNQASKKIQNNYTNKMEICLPPRLQDIMSKNLLVSLELETPTNEHINMYILGTVHIGSESAKDAVTLLETIRPSNVVMEIPPSRYKNLRKKYLKEKKDDKETTSTSISKEMNVFDALSTIPKLAISGWSNSGLSGFLFSTFIVGSSLVKRSLTSNEEQTKLPRQNEFTAAVQTALDINATIIPADFEFEELIQKVTKSISALSWIQLLFQVSLGEVLGFIPVDPIRRIKGESINEWEIRRRNIETSRSSKKHGELVSPALSKVLVEDRDKQFVKKCVQIMNTIHSTEDNMMESNDLKSMNTIVCLVGLVHLDGVVEQLQMYQRKH